MMLTVLVVDVGGVCIDSGGFSGCGWVSQMTDDKPLTLGQLDESV